MRRILATISSIAITINVLAPQYIASFLKTGQAGVKHDVEGTGLGWKTEMISKAADAAPPIRCNMERPAP